LLVGGDGNFAFHAFGPCAFVREAHRNVPLRIP
jgi:hypothetical protein